jgi:hypothetical protein
MAIPMRTSISAYKFNGLGGTGPIPHIHVVPIPDAIAASIVPMIRKLGSGIRVTVKMPYTV